MLFQLIEPMDMNSSVPFVLSLGLRGRYTSAMTSLSDHLFWDVDRSTVDPEQHAAWLVKRVLEYGRWADWQQLVSHYGKPRLAELATGLRSLHPRAFAFCCAWFDLPSSSFRCSVSTPFP